MSQEQESVKDLNKSVLAHNIQAQFWDIIKTNLVTNEEMDNYDQMGCCVIAIMYVLHGLTEVIQNGTEKDFTFKNMLDTLESMHSKITAENKT